MINRIAAILFALAALILVLIGAYIVASDCPPFLIVAGCGVLATYTLLSLSIARHFWKDKTP